MSLLSFQFIHWSEALVFLLILQAVAFLNEVYPYWISTSQIRLGLSSWVGRRGLGCASDRHIGEWLPWFPGLVSCTSHSWYLHSTVPWIIYSTFKCLRHRQGKSLSGLFIVLYIILNWEFQLLQKKKENEEEKNREF